MFESLSEKLGGVFQRLRGKGLLTEDDVNAAMREVRIALLEADVALPVAKDFIQKVKEKAVGEEVIRSVSPGQMVVKIVQDALTDMLGSEAQEINLATTPPAVIMMVGLQGSGKTTSSGKLGLWLKQKQHKKVLLASLDIYRPAAQEQLATVGKQVQIDTLPIVPSEKPVAITKRALEQAKLAAYDLLILDTAGRLHIDEPLMQELQEVRTLAKPVETLLVADSLTGQDAVTIASQFHEKVGISGIILTRVDGDARGGAALSMRAVTGQPIKFIGVGEKLSEFEVFHPERIAARILDMGDIVSLVERAAEEVDKDEAARLEKKLRKGQFSLDDLAKQLQTIKKMGGMGGIMNMIPGIGKMKQQLGDAQVDERMLDRQIAIIRSMTAKERTNPTLMNGSRKRRVASGSGTSVQDVNRLLKQFKQMAGMLKKLGGMDKKALMRSGLGNMLKGGM
ncbi:MAG: signal recognition particle protein [Hyphomicrobiales bacterium]|nr:signal recognition particle protein [Hyphomicrobiales bacterium]